MPDLLESARAALHAHYGFPDFRPAQLPVVRSVLAGRDTLAVLPTGGGKSICFQVPALVMPRYTLVVSPLVSLMQDQVSAARDRGIAAAALTAGMSSEARAEVWQDVTSGRTRLLYASPERLASLAPQLGALGPLPSLLAVDEAHCISEWGHDFRTSYRALGSMRRELGSPPVVALTGSATPAVRDDIARSLELGAGGGHTGYALHVGSFDRPNLWFGARRVRSDRERIATVLGLLRETTSAAIVYAPTRSLTESLSRAIDDAGKQARPYHAGLSRERRDATLGDFLADRLEVVVATCAFGMGIDKPTVRLVVHWMPPPTPESYYQEAGRAGRDGAPAQCWLLWRPTDLALHRRQLAVTFPPKDLLQRVWREGSRAKNVPSNVRDAAERLRRELKPENGRVDWAPVERRRRAALVRVDAVARYAAESVCRRRALVEYFGETLRECAGCDRCVEAHHSGSIRSRPAVAERAPGRWSWKRLLACIR